MLLAKSFRSNLYMKEKTDVCAHSARCYMMVESNKRPQLFRISFHHRLCIFQPIHKLVGRGGHWWRLNRSTDAARGGGNVWAAEDR